MKKKLLNRLAILLDIALILSLADYFFLSSSTPRTVKVERAK